MKPKIIAYYLPQYHQIQENDEWWGEGFTEWTNVKKARPLFKEHYQPRVPLNKNYYNLMNKSTAQWQTDLCKNYGVDGFAYYHYWFNGKLLLEKPAENLLNWKEIDQNFFFFWANHTWYKAEGAKKNILIEQTYPGKEDWEKHYCYLRKFFFDSRYMKNDDKPIIGIYSKKDIPDYDNMIKYWKQRAKEDGFDGIYVIDRLDLLNKISEESDSGVISQPLISRTKYRVPQGRISIFIYKVIRYIKSKLGYGMHSKYIYDEIGELEASENSKDYEVDKKPVFYGISCGWDNTPRHGKRGQVMVGLTPNKFKSIFERIYLKSIQEKKRFIFINAWNEWAEGMYLEPDEKNGLEYLEAIRDVIESHNA